MNFMKLYIGDYQRDTGHLSIAEHGAYLLMLQHHYATEKPLPTGKALHRLLRAETRSDREAIDSVVSQFWSESNQGLINVRASIEIQKADHQRTVNKEVGKLGGRPRKTEPETESVTETKTEPETESESNHNPSQTPDSRHQTPDIKPPPPGGEAAKPPTPKRATQLPTDFYPNETGIGYAEQRHVALAIELESFRNWHAAKGTTMKDWQAAWRTWCDKAVEFGRSNGARASPARTESIHDKRARAMEELTGQRRTSNERNEIDITGEAIRVA